MKNAIKWMVLALVVIIVIGVLLVFLKLDSIVKSTVQSQTENQLKLKTDLGGAHVSVFGGKVKLSDLKIGSPQGFTAPEMFALGGVNVGVSYRQLPDDPIRINNITIDTPKLILEQSGGNLNVTAAMDQLPKSDTAPATRKRAEGK